MLSIGMGGDVGYYERGADDELEVGQAERARGPEVVTEQLHAQGERAGNYYDRDVMAGRELPGVWRGPGAEALGLRGRVNSWQLHKLYGEHIDPVTETELGNRPRTFSTPEERLARKLAKEPFATPDRVREIELSVSDKTPQNRNFFDLTFSLPKSYSLLHAALLAAGRDEEAQKLMAAHRHAIDECMAHYMTEAGYSRRGHHGKPVGGWTSGDRVEAHDFIYSYFDHRTSRCGDPQLHTHVLLVNKVLCADGVWRTLDSKAIVSTMQRSVGAMHERLMAEETGRTLGLHHRERVDGFGWEVEGITQEDMDLFSTRSRAIDPLVAEMVARYVEKYNREPNARERDEMRQSATLLSRPSKPHDKTYEEYVASWDDRIEQARGEHLADILERVPMGNERPEGIHATFDRGHVIALALANVERKHAAWNRPQLRQALSDALPPYLGRNTAADLMPLLDELVDDAVMSVKVTTLHQPAAVDAPASLRHANGRSVYEPFHVERWATAKQLSTEAHLVAQLHDTSGPRITRQDAERLIAETTLYPDQAEVYREVLTSGRRLMVLASPAGCGKSFTVGQVAEGWDFGIGGRVIGLSKNQNATGVLRDEGIEHAHNVDRFLVAHDAMTNETMRPAARATIEQRYGLDARSLIIIDEVSTVSDDEKHRLMQVANRFGATVLMVGDPEQVGSVDVGSALRLLTQEVPPLQLETVRRFDHEWEGPASLELRERKHSAIVQYDAHGRILEGTREEMTEQALRLTTADLIEGRDALLMVGSSDQADTLSSHIRQRLIDAGVVDNSEQQVDLHNQTHVSPGDIVQARLTTRQIRDAGLGEAVSNRDTFHVERVEHGALVVRQVEGRNDDGSIQFGPERTLPAGYVSEHVELAYATTVHSKIGRTVERSYSLLTDSMDWHALYTGMTRGKDRNVVLVPVKHEEGVGVEKGVDVLARLAERPERDMSATEAMREEMDSPRHMARLGPIYDNELMKHSRASHESLVVEALGPEYAEQLRHDEAADGLYRLTRALEREGHDVREVLRSAVGERDFADANSIAQVLHWRITNEVGPVADRGEEYRRQHYAHVVPAGNTPELDYLRKTAEVMDRRVDELGARQVQEPEPWAIKHLGPVPDDVLEREEWAERAGQVSAYRERYGVVDDMDAIGNAPGRKAAEQRAEWEVGYEALGRPAENEDMARLSDGELLIHVDQYRRVEAWLPPDVSQRLRTTAIAARDYEAQAVEERSRGDEAAAERAERLAVRMADREAKFGEVVAVRREAEAATTAERERANQAQRELDRRHERTPEETPPKPENENVLRPTVTIDEALDRARQVALQLEAERAIQESERVVVQQEQVQQDYGYER